MEDYSSDDESVGSTGQDEVVGTVDAPPALNASDRHAAPEAKRYDVPDKSNRGRQSRPRRRVAFEDLTPDRQSEITGRREAAAAARRHRYRPAMPTVAEDVELHMPGVVLLFEEHFRAVNEYAVALDEVARDRLHSREDYNNYLQEFDSYIAELKELVAGDQEALERASSGGMTASPRPLRRQASIQSNRSMQMLRIFEAADMTLRHASFLSIYGDDVKAYDVANRRIVNGIQRCAKKLRKVKYRAFRQIIEERQLDVKYHDSMRLADMMALDEKSKVRQRAKVRFRGPNPEAAVIEPIIPEKGDADIAAKGE